MNGQRIEGSVAVVTGANRGIGAALVNALLDRGATKIYAAARRPESLEAVVERAGDRVVPLQLDVTDPRQIQDAAGQASDATLLINNAGVAGRKGLDIAAAETMEAARHEMEVNFFGLLSVTSAFSPVLAGNGGGTVVNLASVASFVNFPPLQSYSASKAAVHSATQGLRVSLARRDIRVLGVYPGPVDTDMAEGLPMEKTAPDVVAHAILDGVESGAEEIFPDPAAREMGGTFLADPKGLEKAVAASA